MMVPADNKLPQPPNSKWHDPATDAPPVGQQIALTDATKTYVWIGYISDSQLPLPPLPAGGLVPTNQDAAYWSSLADQS
jgi:hypothetical protein